MHVHSLDIKLDRVCEILKLKTYSIIKYIHITIQKNVEHKKTCYRYIYIILILNILRLIEHSNAKNRLLNFHRA